MIKKSDIVKEAVQDQDWKKALQIAKDFRIGVTQEQRNKMARAYECIVHPDFYQQIGIDIPEAIEQGKAIVKEYAESARRKNTIMKWDVKHDRAKKVISHFLDNAGYWQGSENLTEGLSEEEKQLVNEEVALMIASIRKRYKLQVRLPEVKAALENDQEEPVDNNEEKEKPKRGRKPSASKKKAATSEKKATTRKPRAKKSDKEVKENEEI